MYLDCKNERHGDQGLLSSRQLIHLPHLVVLPGEADTAGYSSSILQLVCLVNLIILQDTKLLILPFWRFLRETNLSETNLKEPNLEETNLQETNLHQPVGN